MKKQFLAIVLAIALVLTLTPASIFADEEVNAGVETGTETVLDNNAVNENEETAENVPEVIAPETEGGENNEDEIGAADENGTDVTTDNPTDVVIDEPTDVTTDEPVDITVDEPTDVTTDEPTDVNAEFEAVLNVYREMEKTPFNIRRVIDILGFAELFDEDAYCSDEELMNYFEDTPTMAEVVDTLYSQRVELLGMDMTDNGDVVKKNPTIAVVAAVGTDSETFSYNYGEMTSGNMTYTPGNSLSIKPKDKYKIISAVVTAGTYMVNQGDEFLAPSQELCGTSFYNEETGEILIDSHFFDDSSSEGLYPDGFYPEGNSFKGYKLQFTITTAKADAGSITLSENINGGATYSMTTTSTATGALSDIQKAINNQKAEKMIVAGTEITFTVDPAKIASATEIVDGKEPIIHDNFSADNSSFAVTASQENMTITFTYKEAANLSNINITASGTVTYDITVNGFVKSNLSEEQLKAEIAKYYVGDEATIKVNLSDNQNIIGGSTGSGPLTVANNAFNVLLDKDMSITLTARAANLELTVSKYNGENINELGNAVFVVAHITNFEVLDESAITNESFVCSKVSSNTNIGVNDYKDAEVNAERNGAYFAMGFEPKVGDDYLFDYTIDVTASARYNGTPVSKVVTVNINK